MFHDEISTHGHRHGARRALAQVVAVNMGYGHERPARALSHVARNNEVIIANDYHGIPKTDKRLWEESRKLYEYVSQIKRIPFIGEALFATFDAVVQSIEPLYPKRDLSSPTLQLRQMYRLIHNKDFGKHLITSLQKHSSLPLLTTFFLVGFMAEEHGYYGDIYVLVTDSDIARVWAPLHPQTSRIKYLAPTGRVVERLQRYGVARENITLTGFPLDFELLGGVEAPHIRHDLKNRLHALDPHGVFYDRYAHIFSQYFSGGISPTRKRVPMVMFAVGGAGAQTEIGVTVLRSLAPLLRAKKLSLCLVAGSRKEVCDVFTREVAKLQLQRSAHVSILYHARRSDYFDSFVKQLRETDVLWTKPSELSFFAGAGIPIIMSEPVGAQERYNAQWLQQMGAGIFAYPPEYAHEWLMDWIAGGILARMAWNGFVESPTHGIFRIEDVLSGQRSELPPLPFVV